MLHVTNLSFDYADMPVLNRISFHVPSGKLLHLRGENGAGKTTLLKILAGLFSPHEGEIRFQGHLINRCKETYHQQLCYIGHKPGINAALTPRENARFDLKYGNTSTKDWMDRIAQFSLTGLEDTPCNRLSTGQRRRVALLRLFYTETKLWLLDEPFVGLDANAMTLLANGLLEHLAKGGSVVMTSHQAFPTFPCDYLEYVL